MKKKIFTGAALFCMAALCVMAQPRRISARSASMKHTAAADSLVGVYLSVDPYTLDVDALERIGVKATVLNGSTYATARVPLGMLGLLSEVEGVKYVHTASQAKSMLDIARDDTGISDVNSGTNLNRPYTGKGVVVGIIDAGFDYTHAAFRDSEGKLRIKRVWEQAETPSNDQVSPETFGYGIELSTPEAIESAEGDILNNSHGTHVAALAAGSDQFMDGAYLGMAPDADIVLVSIGASSYDNVNISNAIAYIFEYAEAEGKPCVINLSLGCQTGPHDGTSAFDVIADALQGPGRVIVGAAGNHRADLFHVSHSFSDAAEPSLLTMLDFGTSLSKAAGGTVEFWGDSDGEYEVAICDYNTSQNEISERVMVYPASSDEVVSVSLGRNITGDITVASEISPLNDKHHVMFTSNLKSVRAHHAVVLEVKCIKPGSVDIWADNSQIWLSDYSENGFTGAGPFSSISEIGGTAKRILSVGSYTTRNQYTLLNETNVRTLNETVGTISSFSGCGPTADGRIKPQIAAPGCFIVSAVSQNDRSGTLQIAQSHTDGSREHLYGYMQGTSMSSPIVAGIVATWLEACPTLTPEQLVDVVSKTALQVSSSLPDNNWGHGKIDAYSGLLECVSMSAGISSPAIDKGLSIYTDADNLNISFINAYNDVTIDIYSPSGLLVASKKLAQATSGQSATLDLAPLQKGVYILNISADSYPIYTQKLLK